MAFPRFRGHIMNGGYASRDNVTMVPLTSSPTSTLLSAMASPSPTTLTTDEQRAILRATQANVRDHLIYSLAVGTGLFTIARKS